MLIFHQVFVDNLVCVPNNMLDIKVPESLTYTMKISYFTTILIINLSIVAWKDIYV